MGIFASDPSARALFQLYSGRIEFRDKVLGGVPKNPAIIEGWLRSKAGISDDDEVFFAMKRTLADMGAEVTATSTMEAAIEASKQLANRSANGFKVDPERGLYIEGRQLKAAIKESTNVLYAGEKWGKTNKGPKNYTTERVFVANRRLFLDRSEPDGVELVIGQVTGPQGPRSTLTHYEYLVQPGFDFVLMVMDDSIKPEVWPRLWTHLEMNGLGACRSQGHGTCDLVRWDKRGVPSQQEYEDIIAADREMLIDRPLDQAA